MELRIEHLGFSYRKDRILRDISFYARGGEVTAIIGANAVGKSTLLKCISGILRAQGEILLDGQSVKGMSSTELTRRIGYLTQENPTQALLSVFEVVLLGRMASLPLKIPTEELEKVWAVMREVKIDGIAARGFHQLSGGQRRVVSILQAIVREPEALLLDEPIANLDIQHQLEVLDLVRDYTRKKKTATVVTLHELNMAARYADRVVVLKDGMVYKQGIPKDVFTAEMVRQTYQVEAEITADRSGIPVVNPLFSVRTGEKM